MVRIDDEGYFLVKSHNSHGKVIYRDWWIGRPRIDLSKACLPKRFHGKRVRFKIELVDKE